MKTFPIIPLAAVWLACFSSQVFAEADDSSAGNLVVPAFAENTLGGDWNGVRSDLFRKGVDFGFTHKSDVLRNFDGGIKTGNAWMGHTEARLTLDMEKLLDWQATTAYVHYHSNMGSKVNQTNVGAFVGVDNIEVSAATAQFDNAWIERSFADGAMSLKAGLYAVDTEFYVTDTSGVFLQPPYGIANEMAQAGVNGPPIFPLGAVAVRAKFTSKDRELYAMGVVTDGVPGDPGNPRGTHVQFNKGDGTLSMLEIGYTPQDNGEGEIFNKSAIGLWRFSSQLADVTGTEQHHAQGAYMLSERTLMQEQGQPDNGLAGFLRFGVASDEVNASDWSASVGLRYHGLVPGRDDDIAGVAVTVNHAGGPFRSSGVFDNRETDVELTYRYQARPWLAVQPSLQYISNPGFDPSLSDAVVAGFRVEIEF